MPYREDDEFMAYVGHLIEKPSVQRLKGITHHIHSNRLEHSINVSYTSYKIAKKFGWNARKITKLNRVEEDIIIKHMWGATLAPPRYKESFVVTMVDKYWAIKEATAPWRQKLSGRKKYHRKMMKS